MRKILICSVLMFFAINCFAVQDAGIYGADFLTLDPGARSSAMAGAFVAMADDINAIYFNPAGLVQLKENQIVFTHIPYLCDINYEFVGYVYPGDGYALGIALNYLYLSMDATDLNGTNIGPVNATDAVYLFSFAKQFGKNLSSGVNIKIINSSIGSNLGQSIAFDFGGLYQLPDLLFLKPRLGVVIQNMGRSIKLGQKEDPLPLVIRAGLLLSPVPFLKCEVDINKMAEIYNFGIGAEYELLSILSLRAGYKIGDEIEGLSAGFGICSSKKEGWQFDYAFVPTKLGVLHKFSLISRF